MNSPTIKKERYRHSQGKHLIEVHIKSPLQLFDARDPAPFRLRDLDDDFVEYIVASAREFSLSAAIRLVIQIDEAETKDLSQDSIKEAIRSFFIYKAEIQDTELKAFIKRSQLFLVVGLLILIASISASFSIPSGTESVPLGILREGIIIFGWVSMWKPIELILFDWYPLYEKLRFYRKLSTTEIEIQWQKNQ